MSDELHELKERLSKLPDDQLIEMVTTGARDYRQEALDYANAELKYRRVDLSELTDESKEPEMDSTAEQPDADVRRPGSTCLICGGHLRPGTLVAEKELSIVFSDTNEERFVRVAACVQCGHMLLVVDYDTEVEK